MSVAFASGTRLRRTTNLPASGASWSICTWVNLTAGGTGSYQCIFQLDDAGAVALYAGISTGSTGTVLRYYSPTFLGGGAGTAIGQLDAGGAWTWCCVSHVGGAGTTCYVAQGGKPIIKTALGTDTFTGTFGALTIGDETNFDEPMVGLVRGFKMFDVALTDAEAAAEALSFAPTRKDASTYSSLIQPAGIILDQSGRGRNWTLTGTPTINATNPPIAA